MKSGFQTSLKAELRDGSDKIWIILAPLVYCSELLDKRIVPGRRRRGKEAH